MTKSQALEYLRQSSAALKAARDNFEERRGFEYTADLLGAVDEMTNAAALVLTRFAEFEEKEVRVAA